MFDAVLLAQAKSYTDSQQLASIETHNILWEHWKEPEITVPSPLGTGVLVSDELPTPEELRGASVNWECSAELNGKEDGDGTCWTFVYVGVAPSSPSLLVVEWQADGLSFPVITVVANETGEHSITAYDQTITVEIPRTGLYIMVPDETIDFLNEGRITDEQIQQGWTQTLGFRIAWESVKTIDPKFLPGPTVIDLTKYDAGDGKSLNDEVLELFANGGGIVNMSSTDGTDAFWRDVSAGDRIQFVVCAEGYRILSDANCTMTNAVDGNVMVIETSFLVSLGTISRVTILFGNSDLLGITVVVEPLTAGAG